MNQHSPENLPSSTSPQPPEAPLLSPEWVASFTIYWKALDPGQQAQILKLAETAAKETSTERSICATQEALRILGMLEVQIVKLILTRYLDHIRLNVPQPAQSIAAEIIATLKAIAKQHAAPKSRRQPSSRRRT